MARAAGPAAEAGYDGIIARTARSSRHPRRRLWPAWLRRLSWRADMEIVFRQV